MPKTRVKSKFELFMVCLPEHLIIHLLSFIPLGSIVNLGKLSRIIRELIRFYHDQVWDLETWLFPWFNDIKSFQSIMHKCSAVIAGSQATQFFDRCLYPCSDMEIIVRVGGAYILSEWLINNGYNRSCRMPATPYNEAPVINSTALANFCIFGEGSSPVIGIYEYLKHVRNSEKTVCAYQIQVVVVKMDPVHHVLFNSRCSAAMNFLSAYQAVSVFPRTTFINHRNVIIRDRHGIGGSTTWMDSYQEKGFTFIKQTENLAHHSIIANQRSIMDTRCWTMEFRHPSQITRGIYGQLKIDVPFDVILGSALATTDDAQVEITDPWTWP